MTNTIAPGTGHIGTDPFVHMAFLISSPARVLALRLALSRVIRENSVVLDAGCGALGLLAIMAAHLGAARVVAVDSAPLDFAQRLAAENGVADRIDFLQGDLHDVALPAPSFDVILGMIYNNEVKSDLAQQNLMSTLVKRHGHSETAIIPNRVRYSVAGYDCPLLDDGDSKRIVEWETHIENTERHLVFDDILIRTTESMNPVVPAALVETGESAVLSTGPGWQDCVPLKVEKR